jgi:DNA-binding CsgD family transcriptional regulator
MEALRSHDLAVLLRFLRKIYAVRDLAGFRSNLLSELPKLVPLDTAGYTEVNNRDHEHYSVSEPAIAEIFPGTYDAFTRHMHEHPLISHYIRTEDNRVLKISDFVNRSEFHNLGIYQEFFRPVGIEYQMAVTLPAKTPGVLGITVSRSSADFTERERLLLSVVRPHLVQAHENASVMSTVLGRLAAMNRALEHSSGAVTVLDQNDRITLITPAAERLLTEYFEKREQANCLPDTLVRWIRDQRVLISKCRVLAPLIVDREGKRLIVRISSDQNQNFLFLKEEVTVIHSDALRTLGVTAREAEVLAWVAKGKTNSEIAAILGLTARTVEKHLQNIFCKLGVESRTAAAARVWEVVNLEQR